MFLVGRIIGLVDIRLLILSGLALTTVSLYQMSGFSLTMASWRISSCDEGKPGRGRRIRARRQGLLPYRTCFLAAAERTQLALVEASAELQRMLDALNDGRAARGLPPLDVQLTPLGSPQTKPPRVFYSVK
jgi:uncharacterized protein YkwD